MLSEHSPNQNACIDAVVQAMKTEDVNAQDSFGVTALHLAVNYGQLEVVKLLLQAGANVSLCNNKGSNVLHATTTLKSPLKNQIVDLLLEHGLNIDSVDDYGQTALHLEARWGDNPSLLYLIEKGASLDIADKFGATALHHATGAEQIEQVEALLKAGADVDAVTDNGQTAIDWAKSNIDLIRILQNFKLIQLIQNQSDIDDIEYILNHGGQATATNYEGLSLLHLALQHSEPLLIGELLFQFKIEVDPQDKQGRTPLHYAALEGNMAYADLLLANGARINSRDENEQTPLQLALAGQHTEMVQFLKRKGGKGLSQEQEELTAVLNKEEPFGDNRTRLHKAIEDCYLKQLSLQQENEGKETLE